MGYRYRKDANPTQLTRKSTQRTGAPPASGRVNGDKMLILWSRNCDLCSPFLAASKKMHDMEPRGNDMKSWIKPLAFKIFLDETLFSWDFFDTYVLRDGKREPNKAVSGKPHSSQTVKFDDPISRDFFVALGGKVDTFLSSLNGSFHKWGIPQNGWFLLDKFLLKWMIWRYLYFRKPPNVDFLIIRWWFCWETRLFLAGLNWAEICSKDHPGHHNYGSPYYLQRRGSDVTNERLGNSYWKITLIDIIYNYIYI